MHRSRVAFYPPVLVTNPKVPANSFGELIALAKRNLGMTYSSPGVGTTPHLTGELIQQRFHLDIVHVPYKSGGDAVTDLIGGQTQLYFGPTTEIVSHVKAGKLKALTVLALKHSEVLPEVPTAIEGGVKDVEVSSWSMVVAPLRTPRHVVEKISRDIAAVAAMPDFRQRFVAQGAELVRSSPEAVAKFLLAEQSNWEQIVRNAGVKLE